MQDKEEAEEEMKEEEGFLEQDQDPGRGEVEFMRIGEEGETSLHLIKTSLHLTKDLTVRIRFREATSE